MGARYRSHMADEGEWRVVYDLAQDRKTIAAIQQATLTTKDYGVLPEVALFGSDEWWSAVGDGRIRKHEVRGIIASLYMSGHRDWPQFEIDANGTKTQWTREGDESLYREGRAVRVDYVMQKSRRAFAGLPLENPRVLRILVRVDDGR